jgi:hypothetical protein
VSVRSAKSGAKSRVKQRCGGLFTADPDVPADQNGRQVCRCGLLGEAGDAHHTLPDAGPEQAAHLRRYETEENR